MTDGEAGQANTVSTELPQFNRQLRSLPALPASCPWPYNAHPVHFLIESSLAPSSFLAVRLSSSFPSSLPICSSTHPTLVSVTQI